MCEWHYSAAQVHFKCLYCEFFTLCQYCTMIPFIALLEYFLNKDFFFVNLCCFKWNRLHVLNSELC